MKKEIISFVIGAGLVGAVWVATTFCRNQNPAPAKEETPGNPRITKKLLPDVYSARPDKNFPGLKLYESDFLIPLNRLKLTGYGFIDDPNGDYGSANAPMSGLIFQIEEKNKSHYFMISGRQDCTLSELVYMGENVSISKFSGEGNGYVMATYKDQKQRPGNAFVSSSFITGGEPEVQVGIAQDIYLDSLLKYSEKCDPFVWKITPEQLWETFRKALRENDKMTIAKMISFPMDFAGERIYTRADFADRFDEIFYPEYKAYVLEKDSSNIWYSPKGVMLPDRASWLTEAKPGKYSGPLHLNTEFLREINEK